jgi:hypothetical protein
MTAPSHADDLSLLRATVAAQQSRLARLERRTSRPRRLVPLLLVAFLVALMPMGLLAANAFTDLDPAQAASHNPNIDLIFNAGITTGCGGDPTTYCPKDVVTREQMASFLARTAGLGSYPPVVNAKTAQTAANADHATNADQLGGHPANYYQPAGQPIANATNATQLGGQPANAYVRTSAAFVHRAIPANISGHVTSIDSPLTNGQPNVLVFVTHNFNPGAVGPSVYNPHPFGVYYVDGKWTIFNEDIAAMPVNAQFNVLVIQP